MDHHRLPGILGVAAFLRCFISNRTLALPSVHHTPSPSPPPLQPCAQLQNAKPGPTYVADLAAHIDRVDDALATFKRWQAGSMADLAEQQARLEEEVEAAAFRIEDDMLGSTPGVYVPGAGAAAAGAGSGPSSRRTTAEEPGWVWCGSAWPHQQLAARNANL